MINKYMQALTVRDYWCQAGLFSLCIDFRETSGMPLMFGINLKNDGELYIICC